MGDEYDNENQEEIDIEDIGDNDIGEESEKTQYACLENLMSSSSTITKVYDKEITKEEISVVKDAPGANIIIIHSESDFSTMEKLSDDILQEEEGDAYCIIFINEDVVDKLQSLLDVKVEYQNILMKKDIENETSTLLAG